MSKKTPSKASPRKGTGDATGTRRGKRRYFTQQGVALIAVSVATAIVGVFVTEFSTSTNVDMAAARNAEADMKAHFLARSGMNLSQLIIRLQQVLDGYRELGGIQIADYTSLFMGAFGGSKEEVEGLAGMLGGFAADDLRGLGVPEGSFDVQLTSDDSKLNLNCANRGRTEQQSLYSQLAGLLYFDAYNPLFENEDAEGWRRDRETQVAAFMDYVDPDRSKYNPESVSSGAPEDYGYENLRDKYEAKNSYFDTVGEIKLVRGVDDRFWSLFGDAFTVYGECKINLAAVNDPKLIANLILLAAKDKNDPAANDPQNIWLLAQLVIQARQLGFVTLSEVQDLANFVKSPRDVVEQIVQSMGPTTVVPIDPNFIAACTTVQGVELDTNQMNQIAKVGPRRTYRVEATATYGKVQKRIVGVWDTQVVPSNPNTRTPGNIESRGPGAWVYWREE